MDELLVSLGDDAPSGENLEYDKVFTDLLLAAQPGEEKQAGDEIIAAEDPKDSEVAEKAREVLAVSHDLRAAVYLAAAELRMNGYRGFAQITSYVRGCLQEYWETCHPQLDADDDNDPTMRVNAVLGLASSNSVLKALRVTPMTESTSFGKISLRDIAVADGEIPAPADAEQVLDQAGISAAFKDTDSEVLKELYLAASTALSDVKAINAVFDEQLPGLGPDLDPLIRVLNKAVSRLAEETGEASTADEEETGEDGAVKSEPGSSGGAITSPRDVEMALDQIMTYYASFEPSSPLPILLKRAKRLVGADFMTIVRDIAPSGVDNVLTVGGIEEES